MQLVSSLFLTTFLSSLLLPTKGSGVLVSEPHSLVSSSCDELTETQIFDPNLDLRQGQEDYNAWVASEIESNCLDSSNKNSKQIKSCNVLLNNNAEVVAMGYALVCIQSGGELWQYDYSPKCGNSHISQWVSPVLACASPQCTTTASVSEIIPYTSGGFMDPLIVAGYTCGTGTKNLKRYKYGRK